MKKPETKKQTVCKGVEGTENKAEAEPDISKKMMDIQSIAWMGMLTAMAMVLGYVETLIPFPGGIPGMKLGLANIVVLAALYRMKARSAAMISLVRILLTAFTFGSLSAMMYSLGGAVLSFSVMLFMKKSGKFREIAVSVAGGVFHNLGQLLVAAFVLENTAVFSWFPELFISGILTGAFVGIAGGLVFRRLPVQK